MLKLHYRTVGSGPALLLLHGLFGASTNWNTVAGALAERRRVLALDLRNHGRSPHDPVHDYPAMAADVLAVLDAERLDAAAVLGHSLGGKVAMRLALDHPERVERLIVVDVAPRAYAGTHGPVFAALRALRLEGLRSREQARHELRRQLGDERLAAFLATNLVRTEAGTFAWRFDLEVLESTYPRILEAIDGEPPYRGPALFVRGALSRAIELGDEPEIHRLFPAAEIRTVEGAGHWVHADRPAELLALVREFLAAESRGDGDASNAGSRGT